MADLRKHSSTSNLIRFTLKNSSTGVGLTGLSSASVGLIISTILDNEATATIYTVTGATIETITTLGTYAAPTATKCRFKEVDATNHKGLYEFQFADARFSVASAKRLVISVTGAANLLDADYEIQLVQFDPYDAIRMGMTSLPASGTLAVNPTLAAVTHTGAVIPVVTDVTNLHASAATAANLATVATYIDTEVQAILDIVAHATYGNAALNTDLDALLARLTAIRAGYLDNLSAGAAALEATLTAIKGATFSGATDSLEALRDRGDAAWITANLTVLETRLTAVRAAKLDNLPAGIQKNTALNNFEFLMVDSTDNKTGKTGLTVTATRSIDGTAFSACANAAVEVSGGIYKINLAAADLNGDIVTFKFSGAGANDRFVTVKTSL